MLSQHFRLLTFLLLLTPSLVSAQGVDAGRGEVPLTVPAGSSSERPSPRPLILSLHGFGGTGKSHDDYLQLGALADRYGFLYAAPDGLATDGSVLGMQNPRYWNATEACCALGGAEQDDAAYLARLIEVIAARFAADAKRIYVVGHSAGAFMAYQMARRYPEVIAAVVSLAGAAEPEDPNAPLPEHGVHVLQIHGTGDGMISFAGGEIQGLGAYAGALDTAKRWAARNGCAETGLAVGTLDLVSTLEGPETTVTRFTSGCRAGGSAELWAIDKGSHMPALTSQFAPLVVEWLLGHPKP